MAIKTLVTGGSGFIGSNLATLLIKEGYEVAIVDDFSGGKREKVHKEARLHEMDICDTHAYELLGWEPGVTIGEGITELLNTHSL